MTEHMKKQLIELRKCANHINTQTYELNKKFNDVEKCLTDINMGVSAWANTVIGKKKNGTGYKFGFCRIGSNWKLVCRKVNWQDIDNDNYGKMISIVNMPRSIRIEASELISELIMSLSEKVKLFSEDLSEALCNLETAEEKLK